PPEVPRRSRWCAWRGRRRVPRGQRADPARRGSVGVWGTGRRRPRRRVRVAWPGGPGGRTRAGHIRTAGRHAVGPDPRDVSAGAGSRTPPGVARAATVLGRRAAVVAVSVPAVSAGPTSGRADPARPRGGGGA